MCVVLLGRVPQNFLLKAGEHAWEIFLHFLIPKTNDAISLFAEQLFTSSIMPLLIIMNLSINLNDEME